MFGTITAILTPNHFNGIYLYYEGFRQQKVFPIVIIDNKSYITTRRLMTISTSDNIFNSTVPVFLLED